MWLGGFYEANGFAPSMREITGSLPMSTATVSRGLDELEAQGYISRVRGRARTIVLRREYDAGKD